MMNHKRNIILILLSGLLLCACSDTGEGKGEVLVTVNGSKITDFELEQTIKRTMNINNTDNVNKELRNKILETMVLSRVIMQQAENKLSAEKINELETKTELYREELYLKAYLQAYAPPESPSTEMIKEYYNNNPSKFGAGLIQHYEMLTAVFKNENKQQLESVVSSFNRAKQANDWRELSKQMLMQGFPVRYSKGVSTDKILHKKLLQTMQTMGRGDVSQVVMVGKQPYVIRLTEVVLSEPKPLHEVSENIRKMLVPVQLTKALDKVSNELMESAVIEYVSQD